MPKLIADKNDWIKLGYKRFADQGITGIVIEKMAIKLKVNKSSFYWHFKTRDEFIAAIIEHWIATETEHIINQTESTNDPKEKLEGFLTITFKNDPYLEFIFFLKRYAQKKKHIQVIIDDIDSKRLAYTTKLFEENGYSKADAEIKASIFYKYLIGYHEMIKNKKQSPNYLDEVKQELAHFLNI